jgi:hypothetical protein
VQTPEELHEQAERTLLAESALLVEQVAQRATGRVLEDEMDPRRLLHHLVQPDDVLVRQPRVETHLLARARAQLRVDQLGLVDGLDSHGGPAQPVRAQAHLAVRASAEDALGEVVEL